MLLPARPSGPAGLASTDAAPPHVGDFVPSIPAGSFEAAFDSAIETLRRTVLSEHLRALALKGPPESHGERAGSTAAVGSGGRSQASAVSSVAAGQDAAMTSPVTPGEGLLPKAGMGTQRQPSPLEGDRRLEPFDTGNGTEEAAASRPVWWDECGNGVEAASVSHPPGRAGGEADATGDPSFVPEIDGFRKRSVSEASSESHKMARSLSAAKTKVLIDAVGVYKAEALARRQRIYDACVAALIVSNVFWLTFEIESGRSDGSAEQRRTFFISATFCVLFVADLALRLWAERRLFFTGKDKAWNCFDSAVVAVMVVEVVGRLLNTADTFLRQLAAFRVLRLTRLLRIEHLVHSLALQHDFRILLICLKKGAVTFVCVMFVTMCIVYFFSIGITSAVVSYCKDVNKDDELCAHFGTIARTSINLFLAMYDGISWGELLDALQPLGWAYGALFLVQIAFLRVIVINLVFAVLLGIANKVSHSEQKSRIESTIADKEQQFAELVQLFVDMDLNNSGAISLDEMEIAVKDPKIESAFTQLKINAGDVRALFVLLDEHHEGAVDMEEFVAGIQWIRGDAREIDLVRVQRQCALILRHVEELRNGRVGMGARQTSCQEIREACGRDGTLEPGQSERGASQRLSASMPVNYGSAHMRLRPCASIDKPEMRAVTLLELSYIRHVINDFCLDEGWTDKFTGEAVNPSEVTLYTFAHNFIAPKTAPEGCILELDGDLSSMRAGASVQQFDVRKRCVAEGVVLEVTASGVRVDLRRGKFKRGNFPLRVDDVDVGPPTSIDAPNSFSYKELVSSTPTRPVWFCSHWWGEGVFDFIESCENHAQCRGMDSTSATYWVCGYANRQHCLFDDIGGDPEQSSFRKAMRAARGALLHLDADAAAFTRIWCDFEIYCSVSDDSKEFDIITRHKERPVLLSQRPIPGEPPRARALREENFPISLLVKGMSTRLQDGEASDQADKDAILRYLGENGPAGEDTEANLQCANSCFHAMLARSAWRQAVKRGTVQDFDPANPGGLRLPDVLRQDAQRQCLHMSLEHCDMATDAELSNLAVALPPNLRELMLSFEGCKNVSDVGLQALSLQLPPSIRKLKLDFLGCTRIGDAGLQGLARHLPGELQELDVHFDGCYLIGMMGVRELAENVPRGVKAFRATFMGTGVDRSFDSVHQIQRFARPISDRGRSFFRGAS